MSVNQQKVQQLLDWNRANAGTQQERIAFAAEICSAQNNTEALDYMLHAIS